MVRKPSREELERKIAALEPYQEAYYCLREGHKSVRITSEERSIDVVGMHRACGGVIVGFDGENCYPHYLSGFIAVQSHGLDPYLQEIASKAVKLQAQAVAIRTGAQALDSLFRKEPGDRYRVIPRDRVGQCRSLDWSWFGIFPYVIATTNSEKDAVRMASAYGGQGARVYDVDVGALL